MSKTADSFNKDQLFSKMRHIRVNSLRRQTVLSTTTEENGSYSSGTQVHVLEAQSPSSPNFPEINGNFKFKSDNRPGYALASEDPSCQIPSKTVNVVLFGDTSVEKNSVINLIAQREVATVSSDANCCAMQSTRYDVSFDDIDFAIFDTIGLEGPQTGVDGYLKAVEKAHELIVKLGDAGGIHLLLFCIRGGRITAITQSNYLLFCECFCSTKVPIALVFTDLEMEVNMEDWWTRNKGHIEYYGIKSDGHACITAVQDGHSEQDSKYAESQRKIREVLKTCALKNDVFLPEPRSWLAKCAKEMKSFIGKHRNMKRRGIMRLLTQRCKLDPETARKIANMMERDDTETTDGNREDESTSDLIVAGSESEGDKPPDPGMAEQVKPEGHDARQGVGSP